MEKYFSVNSGGCSIRCKLYSREKERISRIVISGHGFGGSKDSMSAARFARRLTEKNRGVGILCFDWPCHGGDVRKLLRLEDCDLYLSLLLADAAERFAPDELYGYANSFGGYLFLKYISEHGSPFLKTALRCPAVVMHEVITSPPIMNEEAAEKLRRGRTVGLGFDTKIEVDAEFIDSLAREDITKRDFMPYADDILIVHGTRDEVVPFEAVRSFAEDNVIDFVPVEGADHIFRDPALMDAALGRVAFFLGMK